MAFLSVIVKEYVYFSLPLCCSVVLVFFLESCKMHLSIQLLSLLYLAGTAFAQATFSRSPKRGLAFAPSAEFPQDNQIWIQSNSD
jgi:hypothetical protein